MTQEREEGSKDAVGSLRSWAINCFMTSSYNLSVDKFIRCEWHIVWTHILSTPSYELTSYELSSYELTSYELVFLPSSRSPSTGPPRTLILLRLFEPSSSIWVALCLPVHTRKTQYKTVYACRSSVGTRHRAQPTHRYPPHGSFPCANTTLSRHSKQSDLLKVGKETWARRTTFQVTFDGWAQVLFGIENWLFIKWCPEIIHSKLNVVHNSKLNVDIIDLNFHSDDSNFTKTHQLLYVSVSPKVSGRLGLDGENIFCTVLFCSGESLFRQLSWSACQGMKMHTKCGLFFLFCCYAATHLALQIHQERTQVCTVSIFFLLLCRHTARRLGNSSVFSSIRVFLLLLFIIGTWFSHELT